LNLQLSTLNPLSPLTSIIPGLTENAPVSQSFPHLRKQGGGGVSHPIASTDDSLIYITFVYLQLRYKMSARRHSCPRRIIRIAPGGYARVQGVDEKQNHVTVERGNGQRVSYDPRRLQGLTLCREQSERSVKATAYSSPHRIKLSSRSVSTWLPFQPISRFG